MAEKIIQILRPRQRRLAFRRQAGLASGRDDGATGAGASLRERDPEELRREVRLLSDNGFAGVEIQPFTSGVDLRSDDETAERIDCAIG